ncbi:MAG: regulatory iron-sulfur-containing complex subunit RicT [Pseudomonadota bacterium]
MKIAKIRFTKKGKLYNFDLNNISIREGDHALVATKTGKGIGEVITIIEEDSNNILKKVLKKADQKDFEIYSNLIEKEKEGFKYCLERIDAGQLSMKLVKVKFLPDGSKAIFYYTAAERVDFRMLVKELAKKFHTRIQMHQIGVRDEAKMVGGLSCCGRELCCSTFLNNFASVSIKMAKDQNLPLNPNKISGMCDRLMCCLAFEHEQYCVLGKGIPRQGAVVSHMGEQFIVISSDILSQTLIIKNKEQYKKVKVSEVNKVSDAEVEIDEIEPMSKDEISKLENDYVSDKQDNELEEDEF